MIDRITTDVRILEGDVRVQLRKLKPKSVHCVVTSPPYWNLRDYGFEGQLGLEPTPKEFIRNLVKVFRAVRRVLRDDGTLWVNMGDSHIHQTVQQHSFRRDKAGELPKGFKVKDKALMPHRLAIALQDDGWFVRQDIVWWKQQPQPETVSDRPTTAHEYLFLLSKSARYWYDAAAIAEACSKSTNLRSSAANALRSREERDNAMSGVGPKTRLTVPSGWSTGKDKPRTAVDHSANRALRSRNNESFAQSTLGAVEIRNKRSVWPVYTDRMDLQMCTSCKEVYHGRDFKELKSIDLGDTKLVTCKCGRNDKWLSHFAAFGAEWIEPAVLAGCPAEVCPTCQLPSTLDAEGRTVLRCSCAPRDLGAYYTPNTVAGTLLDIFGGTGTTAGVALAHGRKAILIEGNPDYVHLMPKRIEQVMRRLLDAPAPPPVANAERQVNLFEMINATS